jgi:hypothetical protein
VVEDFDGARVNPDRDALRVDALILVGMVAVVDVGVLGVELASFQTFLNVRQLRWKIKSIKL